jgi:hypothetical protein
MVCGVAAFFCFRIQLGAELLLAATDQRERQTHRGDDGLRTMSASGMDWATLAMIKTIITGAS